MILKKLNLVGLTGAFCLLATGCKIPESHVLNATFRDYGDAYAEAENRQLLMNFARLSQHDPTYFFQLNTISALYEFTGMVGANGSESGQTTAFSLAGPSTSSTAGGVTQTSALGAQSAKVPFVNWMVNPSASMTASSKPTFTYVPLNGSEFSAHLIQPITPSTFHELVRDGFRIDLLMRGLVQEVVLEGPNHVSVAMQNTPLADNITSYIKFLRFCEFLRLLQSSGNLTDSSVASGKPEAGQGPVIQQPVVAKDAIEALVDGLAFYTNEQNQLYLKKANEDKNLSLQFNEYPSTLFAPLVGFSMNDIVDVNGIVNNLNNNNPLIAQIKAELPSGVNKLLGGYRAGNTNLEGLKGPLVDAFNGLINGRPLGSKLVGDEKTRFFESLESPEAALLKSDTEETLPTVNRRILDRAFAGYVKEPDLSINFLDDFVKVLSPNTPEYQYHARIVLRSSLFVFAAMATEQKAFYELERGPIFRENVPPAQRRPLLKMDFGDETSLGAPLVDVKYKGKDYKIADEKDSTDNHDAFLLAATLFTQLTIDPTKIAQPQQVLQVR